MSFDGRETNVLCHVAFNRVSILISFIFTGLRPSFSAKLRSWIGPTNFFEGNIPSGSNLGLGEIDGKLYTFGGYSDGKRKDFAIFVAVTGRRTWKTWSCVGIFYYISISISYTISYTILRTHKDGKRPSLYARYWHDIEEKPSISTTICQIWPSLYTRYWCDIELFYRYRVRYRAATSGYTYIKGKNFDVVQDIGAISGYTDIKVFPSISKIWSILGMICHTGHVPAPPTRMGPASWSSTSLDGLYSCVTVLTPFPAGVQQLLSVAAVARPWPRVWTAGWSRWAVLISSYSSTSDLVMIQRMSVKYASHTCLHPTLTPANLDGWRRLL